MTPQTAPLAPMTGSGDASAVATNAMVPKNPLTR
jgi:C4-dicarboxylate transporter